MIPHSADAEASVVAACMIAPVVPRAMAIVGPGDFYLGQYRLMYDAIRRLWERDVRVDVVTLADELQAAGEFQAAGGFDTVAALVDMVPNADNVEHHARIVQRHAARRRTIACAQNVIAQATDGEDVDVSNAIAKLIESAGAKKGGGGFRKLAESVWPAMEHFDRLIAGEEAAVGLQTGFSALDRKFIGFHPGDMVVVAARPSMGKSAFATNVLTNVALAGDAVAMVSLEMSADQIAQRVILSEARVDIQALRRGHTLSRETHERLAGGAAHANAAPMFVDDEPAARLPQLTAKLLQLKQRENIKLVAIDYLQLMEADAENRTQEVSKLSRGLKLLAGRLQVPIMVLSQLSRALEARSDKRPMLSDLRESGAIEQDADTVLFLYRPDYYAKDEAEREKLQGSAEVIVAKQRNGPTGVVPMYFHADYARFETLERR